MGLEDAAWLDDDVPGLDNVMGLEFSASQVQSIIFQKRKGRLKAYWYHWQM